MNTPQMGASSFYIPAPEKNNNFSLAVVVKKYLYHWPILIITVAMACVGAYIYLQVTHPVYDVKATLLMKDEQKNPEKQQALKEIDQPNTSKIVENEIEVLKSRTLMTKVVSELGLTISYFRKEGFSDVELYGNSPIKVSRSNSKDSLKSANISVLVKSKNSVVIYDTNGNSKLYALPFNIKIGAMKLDVESKEDLTPFIGKTINVAVNSIEVVTGRFQKSIYIDLLNKQAPAVQLSIKDNVAQRGIDVLNHLIAVYNRTKLIEKNKITLQTLNFIDSRIGLLSTEMTGAEKNVEGYKSSLGLTDIPAQSKIFLENVQTNEVEINKVNVQLNVIASIELYINNPKSTSLASTAGISSSNLNNLIDKFAELQLQREKMLATMGESNPLLNPVNSQLNSTKSAIIDNISTLKSSLLATKREMMSFNSKYEASIKNVPGQERQLMDRERQQEIKEKLYIYLLEKREEVALSYAAILSESQIVDDAYASAPALPRKLFAYISAVIIGLVLGVVFIFIKKNLKNVVTTRKEIESEINKPVFAELSFERSKETIVNWETNGLLFEQFKGLRTKIINLHSADNAAKIILFASSVAGEGKSFICANVATALASSGRKTILIDLDLRKPKQSSIFNLDQNKPGIGEYLKGDAALETIVQHNNCYHNLDIIIGGGDGNVSSLLEKVSLDQLLKQLGSLYDYVLIDSPALHLVNDAMLFSKSCDLTLYTIRQGFTDISEMEFIKDLIDQDQLNNLEIIFNGIQRVKYGYGYHFNNYYYLAKKYSLRTSLLAFFGRFSF